jgi:glycosyltransferase involved in cell wall biosynthesis
VRPVKILHLRDTHEIGGPGKTILETQRAIDSRRFELHIAVFATRHESGESPFVRAAREYGMPVHVLRGFNQYDPRLIWRVIDLVKALDVDIVHAHEVKSDVIAYLGSKLHRVPIVTTLHGWIGNGLKQRLFIALDRRVVRGFDRVIAVSAQIERDSQESGVPAGKLRLLRNAIVTEHYRRSGRPSGWAEFVGQPIEGPVLVSIGRLSPEKGHADLLDALAIVASKGGRFSAVLVGDGPSRQTLAAKSQALGLDRRVHFPGYLAQPARILENADLMVLPSHTEGLPNVALEALMMEVPVLATRVGGTPEVIDDGRTGRLIEPRSPDALARGILEFLADPAPWQEMARRGRARVEQDFSFQTRTRRLEALYLEMLGERASTESAAQ